MTTTEIRKKQADTPLAAVEPVPAVETGSRALQLKRTAGAAGYEDGSRLLQPAPSLQRKEAAEKKKEEEEEAKRQAAAKKSYEEAFGKTIGGAAFDLVHKELSAGKMLGYGKQGFDALAGAAKGIKPTEEGKLGGLMDEAAEAEAVKQFSEALLKWTAEAAKKWLESDDGKALLTKINHWVEGHPWTVGLSAVGLALAAATIAYAANADLPNIASSFKLGKGLKMKAGIDLGKLQELCVQGAELGLSYHSKSFAANVSAKYTRKEGKDGKDGKDPVHEVTVSGDVGGNGHKLEGGATLDSEGKKEFTGGYSWTEAQKKGPDGKPLKGHQPTSVGTKGKVSIDKDGNTVIDASGSIKKGPFSANVSGNRKEDDKGATTTLDASAAYAKDGVSTSVGTKRTTDGKGEVTDHKTKASVAFGDPGDRHTVDGTYDHTKETFTLSTANVKKYTGKGYELTDKRTTTEEGTTRDVSGKVSSTGKDGSATAATMSASIDGKGETKSASMGLSYSKDWFKTQLDLSLADKKTTFGASADVSKGGWMAGGKLKLDLDESRLSSLSLKLGYKDPKEFQSFLFDYSRTWNATHKGYDDKFGAMLETSVSDIFLRVQGDVTLRGGDFSTASVKGIGAYSLSKDWKLLGGAGYKYDAGLTGNPMGGNTTVYGGAQFKNVPILVGYTAETKAWTVGVTIPFPWSK